MRSSSRSILRDFMREAALLLAVYEDVKEERRPPVSLAEAQANLRLDRGFPAPAAEAADEAIAAAPQTNPHRVIAHVSASHERGHGNAPHHCT